MNETKEAFAQYCTTLLAGDWEAWGELHTSDVVKMWSDAPVTRSRREMLVFLAEIMLDREFISFQIDVIESEFHDDTAISWGTYSWETRTLSGEQPLTYDGKFLTVFKKQPDGRWLISHDCFNSNRAPSAD